LVTPFLSSVAAIISFPRSNDIFITDTQMNLNRASEILKRADVRAEVLEDFLFVQLKNAKASDVLAHLQQLTAGGGGRGAAQPPLLKYVSSASFIEDDRTNQILVITPKGNSGMLKDLIDKMDIDVDPLTRSEVFSIKQADATPLATILRQVVTGQQQTQTTVTGARGGRGGAAAGGGAAGGGAFPAAGGGAGAGGAVFVPPTVSTISTSSTESARDQQFSPYVTIVPDDRSNSIVVYGTPSDIKQIGTLIDKIDTVLAQVRIEVVITEVTLSSGQVSGLSSFGLDYHFLAGNGTTTAGSVGGPHDVNFSTGVPAPPNSQTPAFTLQGSITNFGLDTVFNVAASNSKVRVLSAPAITTTHNRQATIAVTENRPILSSTTTGIVNAGAANNNVTSTITYQSIGITLQVTPMVGANGVIQMNISQTAQNIVSEQSINGVDQPIIGNRQAITFVSVHDGDVLVLGGLQTTEHHKTNSKVFILGDIPLIGELFRPVSESDQVTELILFVKPTIVGGANSADVIAKETATHSLASKSVVDYLQNGYVVAPPEMENSLSKQSAAPVGLPHH
jgi:general secretion pathway protein D